MSGRARERILLVDDSTETLDFVGRILESAGWEVTPAESVDTALALVRTERFDLVVTDLKMPGRSGLELLHELRERHPGVEVMMITGYATIEGAVEAVKSGAQEYLAKPFTQDELLAAVRRTLAHRGATPAAGAATERFGLVGRSAGMRAVFAGLDRAAGRDEPVLLLGEPGTGRATAARALAGREAAPRTIEARDAAGAEPPAPGTTLVVRGLEWADAAALEHLLALASGPGRLVVTAGAELRRLAAAGLVRGDLLARLEPGAVAFPPLRERGDDVVLLAELFASRLAARAGREAPALEPATTRALREYAWPGNVGELGEAVLAAWLASRGGPIGPAHLPVHVVARLSDAPLERPLADVEAAHIRAVLARVEGRKGRAAEILGIDRKTLREKLKALGEE